MHALSSHGLNVAKSGVQRNSKAVRNAVSSKENGLGAVRKDRGTILKIKHVPEWSSQSGCGKLQQSLQWYRRPWNKSHDDNIDMFINNIEAVSVSNHITTLRRPRKSASQRAGK